MRQVGAFEGKNTLGTLLDLVEKGEEVVITRHGKPVARMIQEKGAQDAAAVAIAANAIRDLSKDLGLGAFDWTEWQAYRDEGRR